MTVPLSDLIRSACRQEASARKPGNVHPEARFEDLSIEDFLQSADVASPWLARAAELGVGASIEAAIRATRLAVSTNTNLGIALLLAPLAAVPVHFALADGIAAVLSNLTVTDTAAIYRAIRVAAPGGLGDAAAQDVAQEPTLGVVEVMRLSADRDRIARQYVNDFADVLGFGRERLRHWSRRVESEEQSVIGLHLSWLAEFPDTLIQRKCGLEVAAEASRRAASVLASGWPESADSTTTLRRYDAWLRADGHRRNPGTTADLVAATLFAELRDRDWAANLGTAADLRRHGDG